MRRHVPGTPVTQPPANFQCDHRNRVRRSPIMRSDIGVGRPDFRLAVRMADVAFVMRQQRLRVHRLLARGGCERVRRGNEGDERAGFSQTHGSMRKRSACVLKRQSSWQRGLEHAIAVLRFGARLIDLMQQPERAQLYAVAALEASDIGHLMHSVQNRLDTSARSPKAAAHCAC